MAEAAADKNADVRVICSPVYQGNDRSALGFAVICISELSRVTIRGDMTAGNVQSHIGPQETRERTENVTSLIGANGQTHLGDISRRECTS